MPRKPLPPSYLSQIVAILDHPRVSVTWIARAILAPDGTPKIERLARVAVVYPRDGAGRLRMAVTDWGIPGADVNGPAQYIGAASGFGYDKLTAAMVGMTIGGFEVGDHCDSEGRPTPGQLVAREGWSVFGSDVRTS